MSQPNSSFWRSWAIWTLSTAAFPFAGLFGTAVAGRVDNPGSALGGGLAAGLVLGAVQSLASRRRLGPRRWIPATSVGMGVGLLLGASTVDYATSLTDLAIMGALTGVVLGLAQMWALPSNARARWMWAAAVPGLWALGWTVTSLAGIDVEEQYTIYGLSGALTFSALAGLVLHLALSGGPDRGRAATPVVEVPR
jgi:hypothetical protein